jgi:Bacterial protein of unknown function (DUF937)
MPSLLESFAQFLNPEIIGQLGKAVGLDGTTTVQGLDVAGPLLTGAMAHTTSTAGGLDSLMGMVSQVSGSSTPGELMKMVTGGAGAPMLSGLFGSGLGAVSGTLERSLGFNIGPLLGLAAPLVVSQISQRMSGGALDKTGVARLLQDEQQALVTSGGARAEMVQYALEAGREAATKISRYSPDHWNKLRLGPIAAATLVSAASASGGAATPKEAATLAGAFAELKKTTPVTSIFSLAAEKTPTASDLKSLPSDRNALLALVRESVAVVATNNAGESAAYGQSLVDLATKVAEATKEGGFLGIGGTRISEAEQVAIDQVKAVAQPGPRSTV